MVFKKNKNIEVRKSKIHHKGVFAKRDISKGTEVMEYKGRKISKKRGDKKSQKTIKKSQKKQDKGAVYVFELNEKYDIDGNVSWNPAKYINHSCNPNCESVIEDEKRVVINAIRDIKKGEEITYNYGYSLDNFREHPCKCGSKNCVGYIVDKSEWPKLKEILKKEKR